MKIPVKIVEHKQVTAVPGTEMFREGNWNMEWTGKKNTNNSVAA